MNAADLYLVSIDLFILKFIWNEFFKIENSHALLYKTFLLLFKNTITSKMATKSSPKGNCTGCAKEFTLKTLSENDGMCKRCYNTKNPSATDNATVNPQAAVSTLLASATSPALVMPNLLSLMTLETVEAKKKEEPKFDEIVKQWYISKSANGKTQTPKEMVAREFVLALSKSVHKDVNKLESLHCLNVDKLLDLFVEKLVS